MVEPEALKRRRRNRNYEETHRVLTEKAVELISTFGVDALSVSGLARATQINRSTVYYHFESRDELIAAVCRWSSKELSKGFNPDASQRIGIDYISSFVLLNPDLIKLWIDDYIAVGDVRERFPQWDKLVAHVNRALAENAGDDDCDAEVYTALMLTGAFIAPRVFKNSVRPSESVGRIVDRFAAEHHRMLQRDGLLAIAIGASILSPRR